MQIYVEGLIRLCERLDLQEVRRLRRRIRIANRVWIIGNGGSMSIATHLAEDIIKMTGKEAHAISDSSLLSMSANDEGMENMFHYPLSKMSKKGDLIIGLTTSGKSKNILTVILSDKIEADKFLITGLGGSSILADKLVIPCSDVQMCEDFMSIIGHMVCRFYKGGDNDIGSNVCP